NCRCYIVPRTKAEVDGINMKEMRQRADEYLDSEVFSKAEAQGWGVNRAESGEVFTANQFYIKKFPGKAAKILDDLGADAYGLKSYSQAKKVAKTDLPVYNGNADDFLEANPVIKDYHNRPVELDKKNFERHTTGSREYRVEYLEALKVALVKPDEVWINGVNYDNFVTLKYFRDKTLVVISRIRNGTIYQVETWFPLTEKADIINKYRKGLLIYGLDKK
ncbi:MAG: PBECR2 nuclease fold domain-containing protein, partial [Daejeonella sp.]